MLDEKLTNAFAFPGNKAKVTFEADTFAIGPQLGAEFHYGGRVFADIDGRIGALRADSDLDLNVAQNIGPAFTAFGQQDRWTAVAEGGLAVGVMLGPSTSLRAGYRVLYIDSVPTAPSIIAKTEVIPGKIKDASDDVLVHGVTLGVKTTF
jgi:hypothetical protein